MYEEITRKKQRPKGNRRLVTLTSLAVAILVFTTALLVGGYLYYGSFRAFVGDFSNTTSVTYRKGSVQVRTAEEEFQLSRENIYYVYNCIVNAGRGRLGEAPDRQPDAVLHYEFGGRLELWEIKLEDSTSSRENGLFIRYCGINGYEYAYDTDRLSLDRLPLTARENME